MEYATISLAVLFHLILYKNSEGSHFRGGTVSWKHISSNGSINEIEVNYRLGWRLDSTSPSCSASNVKDRTPLYRESSWDVVGDPASVDLSNAETAIICTTYESTENWAYGYNSFLMNVTSLQPFQIRYTGNAWIGGLYGGASGNWIVPAAIDLGVRSDTGQVNKPPSTFSTPIVRLQQGCPANIEIKYVDGDNDRVTCRYATNSVEDECGGVCGVSYPHFNLDQNACVIHYDGLGGLVVVAIALMLEDHPSQTITLDGSRQVTASDPLSKVPLQFIVNVTSAVACNVVPTYPIDALDENTTITIPESGPLEETLYAYASDMTANITQFVILGPLGLTNSEIFSAGENLYASNITWMPSEGQTGKNIICYHAVDSVGNRGQQKCFDVEVDDISSPCEVDNGGCNDICVPQNSSKICNCSDECWEVLVDRKTCAPLMSISCDGKGIEIELPQCTSKRTIVVGTRGEHFLDKTCQSKRNNSHHMLEFRPSDCGVITWANPVAFLYDINLWIWHAVDARSPIITRGEWRKIPVTCSLSANETVDRSFVPELPYNHNFFPEDVAIEGMGEFSFFFEFFTSNNYTSSLDPSDYPLQIAVNDRMYFSLGAIGEGQLIFFTEECVASTTDSTGRSKLTYTFIENGCDLDGTLERYESPTFMENRISLEAFEFEEKLLSDREDAEILIECQVMLCDAADNSTRCYQGCESDSVRSRRSTNNENSEIIRSRMARETFDDDDEEAMFQLTISESPPRKTSQRIILVHKRPTEAPSEAVDEHRHLIWIVAGLAFLILVVIILTLGYCCFSSKGMKHKFFKNT